MKDCIGQEINLEDSVIITMGGTNLRVKRVEAIENDYIVYVKGIKRYFRSDQILVINKLL